MIRCNDSFCWLINILFIDGIVLYQRYYRNQWVRHSEIEYYIIIMSDKLLEIPGSQIQVENNNIVRYTLKIFLEKIYSSKLIKI